MTKVFFFYICKIHQSHIIYRRNNTEINKKFHAFSKYQRYNKNRRQEFSNIKQTIHTNSHSNEFREHLVRIMPEISTTARITSFINDSAQRH